MGIQPHFLLLANPFCLCFSVFALYRVPSHSEVVISISRAKISPSPVLAGFAENTTQAAPPRALPDQRMEPWVSSCCATLSQKGGLGVISALLSLRAPWQHSHLDINTHQKRAQPQTGSPGADSEGARTRSPGLKGAPASPRQGQIWHPSNQMPESPDNSWVSHPENHRS